MLKSGWLFVFAALLCAGAPGLPAASRTFVRAGATYTIDSSDSEDELPQHSVIAITRSRDGYLWLGTLNGLVRFDGLHFEVFDENNTPGLNSSRIVHLFEDRKANLWIGSETAGVAVMKDGQINSIPEIPSGGSERRLVGACEDSNGAVWLYLANGDLWRCWNGSYTPFLQSPFGESRCRALIKEQDGPIWVGTDRGQSAIGPITAAGLQVLPVDLELTNRLEFLLASTQGGYWRLADGRVQKCRTNYVERDLGPYPWGRALHVAAACEDREGNLLVGTLEAGLFWFDSEGHATHISTKDGLSHDIVLSLLVDHEGTLWVGTDGGGLNRIKRQVFGVPEECRGLAIGSVCGDEQGGLWIGFNTIDVNAPGAGYWKEGLLQRFGPQEGLVNSPVWTVFVDQSQRVWAGTHGGLFQFRNGRWFQRMAGADVLAIHQDRQHRLWLGTQGGVIRWDEQGWKLFTNGLSSDLVRTMADDADGNLWVGAKGGSLSRLRDGQFTPFHSQEGLPNKDISALYVDAQGILWVGTDGGGLIRFHAGKWTRYTSREGLISNSIGYLIEDGEGYLWIGSNAGLMRASKKALNDFANGLSGVIRLRAYGEPDGLPTRECTLGSQPGACRTADGKLWFPTIKGLASINPAQFVLNTNPPPVVIESVLIEGQTQNTNGLRAGWPQAITVPAGKQRLEIHYTSLNLAAPKRARFKYRLEGFEPAWFEAGAVRVAHYKLPPGQYRFEVTACNEDGVWNQNGSILALTFEPPFWRTWWFLSATAVCFLGTIVAGVHHLSTQKLQRQVAGLRQQEALEKERARIARDIHDQLGASLTQVALLGEFVEGDKDSPAEVEAHARQICQTARDTTRVLDEIVWTVNPSNDTLDGLITYVCKYTQEYLAVAGLRYRLEVPAQLPHISVPPELRHNVFLAVKEAVTNVVRHAKASAVWLRLKLQPAAFTLEIQDDGRGLAGLDAKAAQARNGLQNMRKRMEDIGGSFSIGPAPEGGTLVCLTAPLRTSAN